MKRIFTLLASVIGFVLFFCTQIDAQTNPHIEFTVKYNLTSSEYEVYGKSDINITSFPVGAGSQLSIVLPAAAPNSPLVITSVAGGPWADNSIILAPTAQPGSDFHGVASDATAAAVVFPPAVEVLLFKFTIAGGACQPGVRMFRNFVEGTNPIDPDSNAPGMAGGDFFNWFANVPGVDYYKGNYNNTGTTCAVPDLDGDGFTGTNDPDDNNACVPDPLALGTNDCDADGLTNTQETTAGTNPNNPDTDGDGLNDGEEVTGVDSPATTAVQPTGTPSIPTNPCSPFTTGPTCDPDNDGLTNAQETTAGTNPTNPDTDGDGLNDGEEVTGVDSPLTTLVQPTGTPSIPTNPCSPFQTGTTCDPDNDGLTNAQETTAGTNPNNPDTDGDGLNDGEEVTGVDSPSTTLVQPSTPSIPTNPCSPFTTGPSCDPDNDGLTNAQETTAGTNPNNPDTDGDGLNDGEEVTGVDSPSTTLVQPTTPSMPLNPCSPFTTGPTCDPDNDGLTNAQETTAGTNPNNPDTDGDGLNDGEEVTGVDSPSTTLVQPTTPSMPLNPCSPFQTGTTCDPDNDGLTNAQETTAGTNPNNPDTDGDGLNDGEEVTGVDSPSTTLVQPTTPSMPLNPCSPFQTGTTCDPDNDGLTNGQEATAGTNPNNPDTDGDGLNDGEEVTGVDSPSTTLVQPTTPSMPLNPCSPFQTGTTCDPDNDGLTNAQETTAGTNPNNPDTDGDGLNDGEEVTGVDSPATTAVQPTGTPDPSLRTHVRHSRRAQLATRTTTA